MSNRSQIRDAVRVLIDQTDPNNSRFTDDELNTLIDSAIGFVSASIAQPRDIISVVTQKSIGAYNLPTDNLFIKQAWFGDITKQGDTRELDVVSQKALSVLFPNWMETNTVSDGRPSYLIVLDKRSVYIFPRPSEPEAGKRLILSYVYLPAPLETDLEVPDIPVPYHHLIEHYTAHLCFLGKLEKPDIARELLREYADKLKLIEDPTTQETEASNTFEYIDVPDVR